MPLGRLRVLKRASPQNHHLPLVNTFFRPSVFLIDMLSDVVEAAPSGRVDLRRAIRDCQAVTPWPDSDARSDASLVTAAREGDRTAYGRLYALYARMVHGILLARVPPNEVDDLVQDVFLHAMPRLGALRDVTRFGGWLATITRNRANDYHRQSKAGAAPTQSLSEGEIESPTASGAAEAEAATILGAIRSLPEAYRETLILRLVEGMTGPEIAERTGLKPGSVRVNLHRGMQQLREKLGQTAEDKGAAQDSRVAERASVAWKSRLSKRKEP